MINKCGYISQS